jgi:hypothetical protein
MRRTTSTLFAVGLTGLLALATTAGETRGQPPRSKPDRVRLSAWEVKAVQTLQQARIARQREEALRALARSREPKLAPVIAHYAAYDPEYSVREAASQALARMRYHGTRYTPPDYPRREERNFVDARFSRFRFGR